MYYERGYAINLDIYKRKFYDNFISNLCNRNCFIVRLVIFVELIILTSWEFYFDQYYLYFRIQHGILNIFMCYYLSTNYTLSLFLYLIMLKVKF